jgi:hypothetical protein
VDKRKQSRKDLARFHLAKTLPRLMKHAEECAQLAGSWRLGECPHLSDNAYFDKTSVETWMRVRQTRNVNLRMAVWALIRTFRELGKQQHELDLVRSELSLYMKDHKAWQVAVRLLDAYWFSYNELARMSLVDLEKHFNETTYDFPALTFDDHKFLKKLQVEATV